MSKFAALPVFPPFFVDGEGDPQAAVSITIYNRGTTVKPTLYTSRTKAITMGNPVTADSLATANFYLDPGDYDALVNGLTLPFSVVPDRGDLVAAISLSGDGIDPTGVEGSGAAMNAILATAGGKLVFVPPGTYLWDVAPVIPANCRVLGSGKFVSTWKKAFDGDFLNMLTGISLNHLTIELEGEDYTGQGLVFSGIAGGQTGKSLRVINGDGPCFYFAKGAGSLSRWTELDTWRVNAGTGTGRYAIVIEDGFQPTAVPRHFFQLETGGMCAISWGSGGDVYVAGGTLGDMLYSDETQGVQIVAARLLSAQPTMTMLGANNSIVACDVYPQVILGLGANGNAVGPNNYNNPPVIDNSESATNLVSHGNVAYTPVLSSNGTAPSLGNGVVVGIWSRHGSTVTVSIELSFGSTTTFGNGIIRVSLPQARKTANVIVGGSGYVYDASTNTYYTVVAQIAGAVDYVTFILNATGPVAATAPMTWAAGDLLRCTLTYNI